MIKNVTSEQKKAAIEALFKASNETVQGEEYPFYLFGRSRDQKEHYLYIEQELTGKETFSDIEDKLYSAIHNTVGNHYGTLCSLRMPSYMIVQAGFPNKEGNLTITTPFGQCPLIRLDSPSSVVPDKVLIKVKVPPLEFKLLKKYITRECPKKVAELYTKDTEHLNLNIDLKLFNSIPNLVSYYQVLSWR